MNNSALAEIFENTARLLELDDENPFRIRAYRNAARSLESLSEDVSVIAARDELREIPGIGPDLESKIKEYLTRGKIDYYESLLKKTPPVVIAMMQVPGVGPKTAKLIYDQLKPRDLAHLEDLCKKGKLSGLPKIQEKTQQNILDSLCRMKEHESRSLLNKALPLARRIVTMVADLPETMRCAYAGSVRRMKETIRDIDILAASKKPEKIMQGFVKMPFVHKIVAQGPTKTTVITVGGIQVDLRVVEEDSFGAALLYFTGSKEHNIKLRTIALKKKWKINEYGLFNANDRRLAGRTEEEMYKALGLPFIPPELREDRGEVEAALKGSLPELVEAGDLRGDFHMHSNWSDGVNEIEDMVNAAKKKGYEYVVLTDHSHSLKIANGLDPKRVARQIRLIKKLNEKLKGITVLSGSEVDIMSDGALDFKDEVLGSLDFVVASVHSGFKQTKEQITSRIVRAIGNRHVDLIGHPTGPLIGSRQAYQVDLEQVFDAASKTGACLEINANPNRLDLNDVHARRAVEKGVTLTIDTDAHSIHEYENLEYGVATAKRAWCEKKNILNCLKLDELRKRLSRKK